VTHHLCFGRIFPQGGRTLAVIGHGIPLRDLHRCGLRDPSPRGCQTGRTGQTGQTRPWLQSLPTPHRAGSARGYERQGLFHERVGKLVLGTLSNDSFFSEQKAGSLPRSDTDICLSASPGPFTSHPITATVSGVATPASRRSTSPARPTRSTRVPPAGGTGDHVHPLRRIPRARGSSTPTLISSTGRRSG